VFDFFLLFLQHQFENRRRFQQQERFKAAGVSIEDDD
jgi:hypothetical protein